MNDQARRPRVANIARHHFNQYQLQDKFLGEASSKVSTLKENYRSIVEIVGGPLSQPQLATIIQGNLTALQKEGRPRNYWEVAFWNGALECAGLLGYLENWRVNGR